MARRVLVAAVAVLAVASTAAAALPAPTETNTVAVTHTLIVAVKKNLAPAAEKRLAVLVLVSQDGGAPAAAVATPSKPLTVLLDNSRLYRVKAEIDASCKGSCVASSRISGSVNHKLELVPSCQPKGSGFDCSEVKLVKVY
jgi:protein-disulfide isomerase